MKKDRIDIGVGNVHAHAPNDDRGALRLFERLVGLADMEGRAFAVLAFAHDEIEGLVVAVYAREVIVD